MNNKETGQMIGELVKTSWHPALTGALLGAGTGGLLASRYARRRPGTGAALGAALGSVLGAGGGLFYQSLADALRHAREVNMPQMADHPDGWMGVSLGDGQLTPVEQSMAELLDKIWENEQLEGNLSEGDRALHVLLERKS